MTSLLIASDPEDAAAAEAVVAHHAQLAGELAARVAAVLAEAHAANAVHAGRTPGAAAGPALIDFCRTELLPHAAAEESTMYPAAQADPQARLLVEAMIAEHVTLTGLVDELASAGTAVEAAALGTALRVLFEQHLAKENDLIVPLLAASPRVRLAELLAGMHELLGHGEGPAHAVDAVGDAGGGCGGSGTCGCGAAETEPVLDVRTLPHAVRHGMVFGALDAVPPGGSLVLVAPHDPLPLLGQLAERSPDAFDVSYLERGPESWRLRLARTV